MSGGPGGYDGPETERTWIVSFADLLSLMLTFMVMLFAMSDLASAPSSPASPEPSRTDRLAETIDWNGRELPKDAARTSVERWDPPVALGLDYLGSVLEAMLVREPMLSGAVVRRRPDRLVLAIPADLLFASGSASPTEGARRALQALTPTLQGIGNQLGVEGRTDSQAPRSGGAFASNWELSLARAVAVADVLRAGGAHRPIVAYGLADSHPDELGEASEAPNHALERRVDLVFFARAGDER